MCELGQAMRRMDTSVALVQKPYFSDGCVSGIPVDFHVSTDVALKSAIIVSASDIDCTVLTSIRYGDCILAEG